jgi:hypothetical protein
MQHTYAELNEIVAAAARYDGTRVAPMSTGAAGKVIWVPMALLLASLVYVLFGGAFAIEASPLSEAQASIASATLEPANVGRAATSISMVQPADYFPAAYPNRGRDGDGNVMTYEHD